MAGTFAQAKYDGISLRRLTELLEESVEEDTRNLTEHKKDLLKEHYLLLATLAYDVPYVTTEDAQAQCIQILEDHVMSECLRGN
jgi:hypothetical protein